MNRKDLAEDCLTAWCEWQFAKRNIEALPKQEQGLEEQIELLQREKRFTDMAWRWHYEVVNS